MITSMGIVTGMLESAFEWIAEVLLTSIYEFVAGILTNNLAIISDVLTWAPVRDTLVVVQSVSTAFLILLIILVVTFRYFLPVLPSEEPPSILGLKALLAVVIIWSIYPLLRELAHVGYLAGGDMLAAAAGAQGNTALEGAHAFSQMATLVAAFVVKPVVGVFIAGIILFSIAILFTIVLINIAKRAVELSFMAIIGPLCAISFALSGQTVFWQWLRHCGALVLGMIVQNLGLFLTVRLMISGGGDLGGGQRLPATVILLVFALAMATWKIPQFVDRLASNVTPSGAAGIAMSGVTSAAMLGRGGMRVAAR